MGFGLVAGGIDLGSEPWGQCHLQAQESKIWLCVAITFAYPNLWTREVLLGIFLIFKPISRFMNIKSYPVGSYIFPLNELDYLPPHTLQSILKLWLTSTSWYCLHSERQGWIPLALEESCASNFDPGNSLRFYLGASQEPNMLSVG